MASPTTETGATSQGDTGKMIDGLREEMGRVGSQVRDYVQGRGGQLAEQATDATAQAAEKTQSLIRERPMAALAIAAGTGLVLGMMLTGGSRSREWTRHGDRRSWRGAASLSRRDLNQLTKAIQRGFERVRPDDGRAPTMDRIAGALSNLFESYSSKASEAASAGSRAAKKMADRIGSSFQ